LPTGDGIDVPCMESLADSASTADGLWRGLEQYLTSDMSRRCPSAPVSHTGT